MTTFTPGITVIVPTYRRTLDLEKCLAALDEQILPATEILITYRPEDEETCTFLKRTDRPSLGAKLLRCDQPGVVYALNLALDAVHTEFFAFTDDDSIPHTDWLQRIVDHFRADPAAAGVGGKDHVCADGKWLEGAEPVVGKVLWYGKVIGHHHLGVGPARYVDTLKGVNIAFRTEVFRTLRLDKRLRGKGAQVGWEMGLCLTLIAQGKKLLYDPAVLVEHYPGARPAEENRANFNYGSHEDEIFNRTLILLEFLKTQRCGRLRQIAMMLYQSIRGTRRAPGVLLLLICLITRYPHAWARFKTTFTAYRAAIAAAE